MKKPLTPYTNPVKATAVLAASSLSTTRTRMKTQITAKIRYTSSKARRAGENRETTSVSEAVVTGATGSAT